MTEYILTKEQTIARSLADFDQRCADAEREFWTATLAQADEHGGDIQHDELDMFFAAYRARLAEHRAALERRMQENLRGGDVLVRYTSRTR